MKFFLQHSLLFILIVGSSTNVSGQAPAAPTSSAASNITISDFSANWNASVGATGYRLDVATNSTFTLFVSGYNNLNVSNVITYPVIGLLPGTTYYYRVRAYNGSGTSTSSATISTVTLPAAPTATAATGITSLAFFANWTGSAGATSYRLDVATDASFTVFVGTYNNFNVGNAVIRAIGGLTGGTTYYFRVRAVNASGASASSNTISCITIPAYPTATAATGMTSSSFSANWNTSFGATGYRLDVATNSTFTLFVAGYNNLNVGNVTTYSVTGLLAGTTYYYRVRAYNGSGTSTNSVTITTVMIPASPIANAATAITSTGFSANWTASTGATSYRFDLATDTGFTVFVGIYNNLNVGNVITTAVSGLSGSTTYYFRVRALNAAGASVSSNTVTVITAPPSPISLAATAKTVNSFSANWNSSTGATGYRFDVATNSTFTSFVSGYNNLDVSNVITYPVSGLLGGTTYYYRVRAYNASATSASSSTITAVTIPAAPAATAATGIFSTGFSANWIAATGATSYRLDVATNAGFTVFVTGYNNLNVGNVITKAITGLTTGLTYYYRLRTVNGSGTSTNSNTITVIPVPAPVATAATAIVSTGFLSHWNVSSGALGYRLDVATNSTFTALVVGYNDLDVSNVTSYAVSVSTCGNTYYYRIRAYYAGGTSVNSNTITVTNNIPTITGVTSASRCDAGTVLLSATASAGVINWYDVSIGGLSLASTASYTTPSISTTTTYYVDATLNGCTTASRTPVVATVNTTPTITGITPSSVCGGGAITLGATASAGTVAWYDSPSGGISLGTGISYTTPFISSTTNYYTDATSSGCTTGTRTLVVATVTPPPTITGTTPAAVCDSGTVILNATASAGTINWYGVATGGISLGAGTSFITPFISSTTSFYIDATDMGCTTGTRTAIIATVNASPTITGVTPNSICDSGMVSLGATASAGTVNWYSASSGGVSLGTGTSFTSPLISSSTTYYVDATANGCTTGSRTSVLATVTPTPVITSTTPGALSGAGMATLGATASAGTINWYATATGGVSLGTGTSYTTPVISVNTPYYVDATNNGCTSTPRTEIMATVNIITFASISNKNDDNPPFSLTATATSGLPVTFSISAFIPSTSIIASVSGNIVTLAGISGTVTIKASQAGDASYAAAQDVYRTFTVYRIPNPITMTTIPNKYINDLPFVVTATPLDGTVTYASSNTAVATVDPNSGLVTIVGVGNTSIIASVPSSATYLASSNSKTLTVSKYTNTVTLANIPNKLVLDLPFYVSATSTNGVIVYSSSNSSVATIDSTGLITIIAAGSTTIKASVPASATYLAGYASKTLLVSKINQTITWSPVGSKTTSDPDFPVSAIASSGLSTVITVYTGPATISSGIVHLTGTSGTVVLRAVQSGNYAYNSITSNLSFSVSTPPSIMGSTFSKNTEARNLTLDIHNEEQETVIQVRLFPNPSKGLILFTSNEQVHVLAVYSLTGQLISNKNYSLFDNQIDFADLPKGIYFIHFSEEKNYEKILVKKIILE